MVKSQLDKMLKRLRLGIVDTLFARNHMSIMHPAQVISMLRKEGYIISTFYAKSIDQNGVVHRVAHYRLEKEKS